MLLLSRTSIQKQSWALEAESKQMETGPGLKHLRSRTFGFFHCCKGGENLSGIVGIAV